MTLLTTIKRSLSLIIPLLFIPLPALCSDYRVINTTHFTFYFEAQNEKLIRPIINRSEELREEIVKDLGIEFEEKTEIYLASSMKKYRELQPSWKVPDWSIGVAYPALNKIIIQTPKAYRNTFIDLKKVFKHEFTHIALGKA
ncbi:MAG TPA: hypothetical protein VMW42_06535, partial [Desulfatiglandales bacterium]|nr:hypothetical protein [Desulfatiglandales bacterium]